MGSLESTEVPLRFELPSVSISLPAPEIPGRPIQLDESLFSSDFTALTAGATFSDASPKEVLDELSCDAGVVHGQQLSVSWRVPTTGAGVEIAPLDLRADRLTGTGVRLIFTSPFRALPHCVSVTPNTKGFVLDFITNAGFWYTVDIESEWLQTANESSIPASSAFSIVQRPYAFDLVSPSLVRSVSVKSLLVGLTDGTLVRLDRPHPLAELTASPLVDSFNTGLGSGLARIFKVGTDKVPGSPSVSLRTIVSIAVSDTHVVTSSVDSSLRLWSLATNACTDFVPGPASPTLRLRPTEYVTINASRIIAAYPAELKVFDIQSDKIVEMHELRERVPEALQSWFVTSLRVVGESLIVAYKINESARIYAIREHHWQNISGYDLLEDLYTRIDDLPEMKKRVLNADHKAREMALRHINLSADVDVEAALDRFPDPTAAWLNMDELVTQYSARRSDLLLVTSADLIDAPELLWTVRAGYVTILKPSAQSGSQHNDEALHFANEVLGNVPSSVLPSLTSALLSQDMLLDRVDRVIDLLRPWLDRQKLSEVSREAASKVGPAISAYAETYGSQGSAVSDKSNKTWDPSVIGVEALVSLVSNYANEQSDVFTKLAGLAVVAFDEGWLAQNDPEILKSAVQWLRQLVIAHEAGFAALNRKISGLRLHFRGFGHILAGRFVHEWSGIGVLEQYLSGKTSLTPAEFRQFEKLSSYVESSAEKTALRGCAALAAGDFYNGESLLRLASPALPRISNLFPGENLNAFNGTSAAWFAAASRFAANVKAFNAALHLAQYGESFRSGSSLDEAEARVARRELFQLAIQEGDVQTAYTTLTRNFAQKNSLEDSNAGSESAVDWLRELIAAAALLGPEAAHEVIASFPFIGLAVPLAKALESSASFGSIPAYKLRYTWHIEREDFVGAAKAVYEQIESEPGALRKSELYTVCLNALAVSPSESRWIYSDGRIVTYDDVQAGHRKLVEEMAAEIDVP